MTGSENIVYYRKWQTTGFQKEIHTPYKVCKKSLHFQADVLSKQNQHTTKRNQPESAKIYN